jgi:hypothetical protein
MYLQNFLLPVFLAALFSPLALPALERHVDPVTGSDSNQGSKDQPFQTISGASAALEAGSRIILAPGIYRETAMIIGSGTKENPAIIESADPARPAILSGADAITGWKPLAGSSLPEAAHPHAAHIHFAEIDWVPRFLFAGADKQTVAREPNSGWFPATTTDGITITSDKLTNLEAENLEGAQLFYFLAKGVIQQLADVKGWAGAKGAGVELTGPLFSKQKVTFTEGDRFYLQNHVSLLDRPKEWVAQKTETGARIFWWPPSEEALAQAESPKRIEVMNLSKAGHLTVRNIHIRHGASDPNGYGIGFENTPPAEGTRQGILLESCSIYQNQRFGIRIMNGKDVTVRHCLVVDNSYGATASKSRNVIFEENQIAWNLNDGLVIAWDMEDVIIRKNAIHHHSRFGHPDNFQTYRGVKNLLFESNVLVASGQGAHNQQVVDFTARNNILAGASANVFFLSQPEPDSKKTGTEKEGGGFTMENNTFALFANGALVVVGGGHTLQNNVFEIRGGKYAYGGKIAPEVLTSKNNRFWMVNSTGATLANFNDGKNVRYSDLGSLQSKTSLEEGSVEGDPGFPSVPLQVVSLDGKKIHLCTESELHYDGADVFKVGDHLEFDFDGVDRTVKKADTSSVVIDPPLNTAPVSTVLLSHWGNKPVGPIDLKNTTHDKRGSDISFEAYMQGDFNNDGKRDVPPWLEKIPSPRRAF